MTIPVGLTGGIGSGKSSVSRLLAARGAYIIDADAIAREVVEPGTAALAELVDHFGDEILNDDGSLNRAALAERAFSNDEDRAVLNGITHPRILALTAKYFDSSPRDQIVVHDIPLLLELGVQDNYEVIVVVDCPDDIRLQRLVERGLEEADAKARIAAQVSRSKRLEDADFVIDNSGSMPELEGKVDEVWVQVESLLKSR